MKPLKVTTLEDYPLILNADHIADILGLSKRIAYRLMNEKNFPLLQIGGSKRVAKKTFFEWIEKQSIYINS